ncbi:MULTISPECIES: mechanosensitive ion channel family protein [Pseudoxanthomonas]|uniref:Small-conductance mechanosensitive channel n=1 Tax=Pseudoxanthomonas taiwanensis J19 TaxID=935569 RepID=A0A562DZ25_9GAMM|nr:MULTISPECIES: mechanosensitive ion channel domain-containing protein [Pseudoxanthomonas]TWH14860.1 small-conductance mechanosensitive channel [Pseudoxanthomonas taiwanensis J19]
MPDPHFLIAGVPVPDWRLAAAYAIPIGAALLLGLLVHYVLRRYARRIALKDSSRARVAHAVILPLAFALPLIFLGQALRAVPMPEEHLANWLHLLRLAVFGCFTWLLVRIVGAVEASILRHNPMEVADNLHARRIQTQTRVLSRVVQGGIILLGAALALMTFPAVRQVGATLLASAGIAGLVAGIAARPVFGNLIAGLQIALAQPIRLDDVVIVEGEWGRIEEITSTYVVVRIWDERRMVVPLSWFIENPFQNWTRRTAQMLGTAFLWLDYRTPMEEVRTELQRICNEDPRWDGRVCIAQVTETGEHVMQVRLLVSARDSGEAFDLRCAVRERMIDFLVRHHPYALPRLRAQIDRDEAPQRGRYQAPPDVPDSPRAEDGEAVVEPPAPA